MTSFQPNPDASDRGDIATVSAVAFEATDPDRAVRGELLEIAFVLNGTITVRHATLRMSGPAKFAIDFAAAEITGTDAEGLATSLSGATEAHLLDTVYHEVQRIALAALLWSHNIVISESVHR